MEDLPKYITDSAEILPAIREKFRQEPQEILSEAREAAQALAGVIAQKKKPVIIEGEQYLEFEDWQTVGRFYGLTAKVVSTEYVEYGEARGFIARAAVIRNSDGAEISAAESMCMSDEPNWQQRPLFQLRSMAQTRACAKALRNVLAWVVVLAGYRPTPAEEMIDSSQPARSERLASQKQIKYIWTLAQKVGWGEQIIKDHIKEYYGIESSRELSIKQANELIDHLKALEEEIGSAR